MIKKSTVKKPIFKKVQTGEQNVEVWITSDGREHEDEEWAKQYEILDLKLNRRYLPDIFSNVEILDFNSIEEFKQYEEYKYDPIKYDIEKLTFPNCYVFYHLDISGDDDYYPEYIDHCVSIAEYKQMILDSLK
jgi:hypothetical protein